jgi:hypothetical protein
MPAMKPREQGSDDDPFRGRPGDGKDVGGGGARVTIDAPSVTINVAPLCFFLDQKDIVFAVTGGRTARTLWDWRKEGLPIRKRGEGKHARYFCFVSELETFLRDTSRVMD